MMRPPGLGLDLALLLPIFSLGGGAGRHVQMAVSASCLGLGHLLLMPAGGVRGEQQPNLLHYTDFSAESSPPAPHILSSVPALCCATLQHGLALF